MKNSEWYLLSDWLRLLVIKKGSTSTKKKQCQNTKKQISNSLFCFQSKEHELHCCVLILKPIWMDYLVYTRNNPGLNFHAFNNQSHEPFVHSDISCELYLKYTTLHCCCNDVNRVISGFPGSVPVITLLLLLGTKEIFLGTLFFHRFRTLGSLRA